MQLVGSRSFPAAAAGLCHPNVQHDGIGRRDVVRRGGCKSIKFAAGFDSVSSSYFFSKDYTASRSLGALATFNHSLSARLHKRQRVVVARAEKGSSGAQKPEKPKREVEKEWKSIPSSIYRPSYFPNIGEYVRSLNSRQRILHAAGFLAMLTAVVWARNLGVTGLFDDTEPLFVEAARQMIVTGDYITPHFNTLALLDKSVLIYWLMGLSAKIFGNNVWAYRLPSCLLAVGVMTGLFLTVSRFGLRLSADVEGVLDENSRASSEENFLPAIITAAAFALNLQVMAWGSTALSDMLLTANVGASLLCFFWGYAGRDPSPPKHRTCYLFSAAFMGLSCLSNGPAGLLLPVVALASFLLCTGELKQVLKNELPVVKGLGIMALINLPWYGMMYSRHGSMFINNFLSFHSFEQFVRGVYQQHRVRPWWFGLAAVSVMYFPWSLSLPSALMKANPWNRTSGRSSWTENSRSRKLALFAAAWFVSGFGLVALTAGHLSSYLPLAPAIALLAASHLSLLAKSHGNGVATGLAPALIYQVLAGAFFLLPGMQQGAASGVYEVLGGQLVNKQYHQIAFVILGAAGMLATRTEEYSVAYGSKHLSSDEIASDVAENSVEGKTLLPLWVLHTIAMMAMLGLFITPCIRLVDSIRQAPVRQLALKAAQVQQPGEALLMVGGKMPSVVYYSQLPTSFFDTFVEAEESLKKSSVKPESVLVISDGVWESSLGSTDLCQEEGYRLMRVTLPKDNSEAEHK